MSRISDKNDLQDRLIRKESENYLQMARLLKIKRPPDAEESIKNILESDIPIEDKIRSIELMDAQEKGEEIRKEQLSNEEIKNIIRRKKLSTKEVTDKNREKIKIKLFRNPFFIFCFKDYKKIREFGIRTGFINSRIFPPGIRLNYDGFRNFFSVIKKDTAVLLKKIDLIISRGWQVLNKNDYNLIVEFKKLCEAVVALKTSSIKPQSGIMNGSFKDLENAFIICHYQAEFTGSIRAGIVNTLVYLERPKAEVELADLTVSKILERNNEPACLYNFILAVNMIDSRRYIDLNDLIHRQAGGVINNFSFNCSPDIQQKINVYINDYTQKLQSYLNDKADINKIRLFINRFIKSGQDGGSSYDFQIVADFYESGEKPEKFRFSEDKDDIAIFAIRYFKRFFSEFENLLIDRINISGFGLIKAFSSDMFQLDMDMLRRMLTIFEQENYSFPKISRQEFLELKQARKERTPTAAQLALIQMVDKLTEILVEIGKKMGQIYLFYTEKNKDSGGQQINSTAIKSYDPSMPYWNSIVLTYGFSKNKVFSQIISDMAGLCFISALYFYDIKIYAILDKEWKVGQDIENANKQLERIADAVVYEKILKLQP